MSTPGTERIAAERQRQIEHEGYTLDHDADHHAAELVEAAIAYASPNDGAALWPWDPAGFKPEVRAADLAGVPGHLRHGSVGDLVKAGALIAAAIDRLLATETAPDHPLTLDEHPAEVGRRLADLRATSFHNNGHTQKVYRDGLARAEADVRDYRQEVRHG
jgi:hypothetical protein